MTQSGAPDDHPTRAQRVRFSFEATSLRQAVEVAGQLRHITGTGMRVRPARRSHLGPHHWAILVTSGPLEAGAIAAFEDEMRRVVRQAPGIRFTGWLCLSGPVEAVPAGERTAAGLVRVLIVDDTASFRRTARRLLESRGYDVVGEADSAAAGFDAVEQLKPDAVLLDVRLPDGSGLDLCELLTREPDGPAVLLASSDDGIDGAVAKARGARGFVSKAELADVDLRSIWA